MRINGALLGLVLLFSTAPSHSSDSLSRQQPRTLEDLPCPTMPIISVERMGLIVEPKQHITKLPPPSEADRVKYMQWSKVDPEGLCRYREENRLLLPTNKRRVVFFGDSITESWKQAIPGHFDNDWIDRGVSGQTTAQMLVRFHSDVIDLRPKIVHIMGGINDIASSAGTSLTRSNIKSMVELAQANGIIVILGAVTPSSSFQGSPEINPGPHILWLNDWLREYAYKSGLIYVDYHSPLHDGKLGIMDGMSNDGIHPNRRGFEIMTPLAEASIDAAFKSRLHD